MDQSLSEQLHSVKQVRTLHFRHTCADTHVHKLVSVTVYFYNENPTSNKYTGPHLYILISPGLITALATCFGLYFAITVAMSALLLVCCVIFSKRKKNEKGAYIPRYAHVYFEKYL